MSELFNLWCSMGAGEPVDCEGERASGAAEQFIAKRPKREALPIVGKAYPLKRGHQVVGETNDFQVQAIGCKHVGMLDKGEIVAWFIPPIGY